MRTLKVTDVGFDGTKTFDELTFLTRAEMFEMVISAAQELKITVGVIFDPHRWNTSICYYPGVHISHNMDLLDPENDPQLLFDKIEKY